MNEGKSKSTYTARMGREFKSVPMIPTSEASRSNKELNVSKMRAGEFVIRRMGAVGYAVKVTMSMRDYHTRMIND